MYKTIIVLVTGLLITVTPGLAWSLQITEGLTHNQVVQCDHETESANIQLGGNSVVAGTLQARVMASQHEVLSRQTLTTISSDNWNATIENVPVGGPYRIDLFVVDEDGNDIAETSVHQVLVGDLWILAGQSNMQGVGNKRDVETPHPQVHVFRMNHTWQLATEPIHNLAESPDLVHFSGTEEQRAANLVSWRDGSKGAGLGLSFAKTMVEHTGRPVGLIATAHGGTSMTQWNPELKDRGGESLYGSMLQSVEGAGGKVRGMLWYQGESDASDAKLENTPLYKERFINFIKEVRSDLDSPDLPFFYVQLGRVFVPWHEPGWNQVQVDQLVLESELHNVATAPAIDLELDDIIHIGTPGLKILGERLALLACRNVFGADLEVGPRPISAVHEATPYGRVIRVTFDSVNGSLAARGPVNGFTLHSGETVEPHIGVYKQELDPENDNAVLVWIHELPENAQLWYGRGTTQYCNLVDSAGMAAPVFGPLAVE